LEPPNLVCVEFGSEAAVFVVMVEDVVDGDEHLAGDGDEGSVVSATFHAKKQSHSRRKRSDSGTEILTKGSIPNA